MSEDIPKIHPEDKPRTSDPMCQPAHPHHREEIALVG